MTAAVITRETLLLEQVELARLLIAEGLYLDLEDVKAGVELDPDGVLRPSFEVDPAKATGFSESRIRDILGTSYARAREAFKERFAHLEDRRAYGRR